MLIDKTPLSLTETAFLHLILDIAKNPKKYKHILIYQKDGWFGWKHSVFEAYCGLSTFKQKTLINQLVINNYIKNKLTNCYLGRINIYQIIK